NYRIEEGYIALKGYNGYLDFTTGALKNEDQTIHIPYMSYDLTPKKLVLQSGGKSLGSYAYTGECIQPKVGILFITLNSGKIVSIDEESYSVEYLNDVKAGNGKAIVRLHYVDPDSKRVYGGSYSFSYKIEKLF
ncbi:MAG: hypothetical protein K5931_09885, partial [Lachnospiraceae bacterium]|nr:hypothetical protein [Lachnospiraceae bacterium]